MCDLDFVFLDFVRSQSWRVHFRPTNLSSMTFVTFKKNREEEKFSLRSWRLSGRRHRKHFLTGREADGRLVSVTLRCIKALL